MYRQKGSTNGFYFSQSLITGMAGKRKPFAVIQHRDRFFAVPAKGGRRNAEVRGAFGFWRIKGEK